jgi:hypothetical protein
MPVMLNVQLACFACAHSPHRGGGRLEPMKTANEVGYHWTYNYKTNRQRIRPRMANSLLSP